MVLVSHKLDEVLAATDEITIMRQGQVVDRMSSRPTTDAPSLARAMVGPPTSTFAPNVLPSGWSTMPPDASERRCPTTSGAVAAEAAADAPYPRT